jgi:hypothetical protein
MELLTAGTLNLDHQASLKGTLINGGALPTEVSETTALLSFADLLRASISTEAIQGLTPADQQDEPQDGQTLTGTGGNFWPLLLGGAVPEEAMPAVALTAPVEAENPAYPGGDAEPLPQDAGLFRAALDKVGRAAEAGNGTLLTAVATQETGIQPEAIDARAADLATQNVSYITSTSTTAATNSTETEPPVPMQPLRVAIPPRLDAPQWGDAFGSRLVWMAKEKHQFAELQLSPPELGSVSVRMVLHENDAMIAIGVNNAAVREAIEASLPRLRQLLAESGISLVNVDVSNSHGFSNDRHGLAAGYDSREPLHNVFSTTEDDVLAEMEAGLAIVKRYSKGLIDHYA